MIPSAKAHGFQTLLHFGAPNPGLMQAAEIAGLEAMGGNLDGSRLPSSGEDQCEWQETLISQSNSFATAAKPEKKLLIFTDNDLWSKKQAGICALVCLQELGCSPDDTLDFLNRLNADVSKALSDKEHDVAQKVHARTYLGG
ncbi:MAG: hypothetical protein JKY60_08395 [Kordiimonadaceae bacterium]|nr:hypothetical protein [Kordiimonadaceae bacterium]